MQASQSSAADPFPTRRHPGRYCAVLFAGMTMLCALLACGTADSQKRAAATERKPAEVMSWQGADWLTRESRIAEEQPVRARSS